MTHANGDRRAHRPCCCLTKTGRGAKGAGPEIDNKPAMFKQMLGRLFQDAHHCNTANIIRLVLESGVPRDRVCDVGAGDGTVTDTLVPALNAREFHAVEIDPANITGLEERGISVHVADLNGPVNIPSDSFDVVISNQVIEHLYDTDCFLSEMYRIVRPGGIAVISTENPASWHNIAALFLGWQPFSLTNVTGLAGGVGNPFAFFNGSEGVAFPLQHHRLFTPRTLKQLFELHGFTGTRALGAGYYPLPASFGRIDAQHAHFISVSGRKPT